MKNPISLIPINRLSFFIKSDELYLRIKFFVKMFKWLHLKSPKSFNEKLQWLKLNDRKSYYTSLVDKYEVKRYVSNLIGKEYVAATYGIWDSPDEIDFSILPDKFVLKTTHGGGNNGIFICKNKQTLNIPDLITKINKIFFVKLQIMFHFLNSLRINNFILIFAFFIQFILHYFFKIIIFLKGLNC